MLPFELLPLVSTQSFTFFCLVLFFPRNITFSPALLRYDWQIILTYVSAWVAQSVECLTLGFGSGHDLTVHGFEPPHQALCGSTEPAWNSLSPSLSIPPPLMCTLTLHLNKHQKLVIFRLYMWSFVRCTTWWFNIYIIL